MQVPDALIQIHHNKLISLMKRLILLLTHPLTIVRSDTVYKPSYGHCCNCASLLRFHIIVFIVILGNILWLPLLHKTSQNLKNVTCHYKCFCRTDFSSKGKKYHENHCHVHQRMNPFFLQAPSSGHIFCSRSA